MATKLREAEWEKAEVKEALLCGRDLRDFAKDDFEEEAEVYEAIFRRLQLWREVQNQRGSAYTGRREVKVSTAQDLGGNTLAAAESSVEEEYSSGAYTMAEAEISGDKEESDEEEHSGCVHCGSGAGLCGRCGLCGLCSLCGGQLGRLAREGLAGESTDGLESQLDEDRRSSYGKGSTVQDLGSASAEGSTAQDLGSASAEGSTVQDLGSASAEGSTVQEEGGFGACLEGGPEEAGAGPWRLAREGLAIGIGVTRKVIAKKEPLEGGAEEAGAATSWLAREGLATGIGVTREGNARKEPLEGGAEEAGVATCRLAREGLVTGIGVTREVKAMPEGAKAEERKALQGGPDLKDIGSEADRVKKARGFGYAKKALPKRRGISCGINLRDLRLDEYASRPFHLGHKGQSEEQQRDEEAQGADATKASGVDSNMDLEFDEEWLTMAALLNKGQVDREWLIRASQGVSHEEVKADNGRFRGGLKDRNARDDFNYSGDHEEDNRVPEEADAREADTNEDEARVPEGRKAEMCDMPSGRS
jgi:hypothetical protein